MAAGFLPVEEDFADLVDRSEIQEQAVPAGNFRQYDGFPVPQEFIGLKLPLYAGEDGFRGKRHKNPSVIGRRFSSFFRERGKGIFPGSVQTFPGSPCHLRARVFRKDGIRTEIPSPFRQKLIRYGFLLSELKSGKDIGEIHAFIIADEAGFDKRTEENYAVFG